MVACFYPGETSIELPQSPCAVPTKSVGFFDYLLASILGIIFPSFFIWLIGIFDFFITTIIWNYFLSCLIVWTCNKVKKS
jgi:hypothetical protein